MVAMPKMMNNHYEWGFVDPPYGIGASKPTKKPNKCRQSNGSTLRVRAVDYGKKDWDDTPPSDDYFSQLFRVTKNQIIWGANHFRQIVDKPFNPPRRREFQKFINDFPYGWIIWDKLNGTSDQFDCELAWTSVSRKPTCVFPYMWSGMMQGSRSDGTKQEGNKKLNEKRFHPTQKPTRIYELIAREYFQEGDKILDTHSGSGSLAVACWDMGFDLDAFEIDSEYIQKSRSRLETHKSQLALF